MTATIPTVGTHDTGVGRYDGGGSTPRECLAQLLPERLCLAFGTPKFLGQPLNLGGPPRRYDAQGILATRRFPIRRLQIGSISQVRFRFRGRTRPFTNFRFCSTGPIAPRSTAPVRFEVVVATIGLGFMIPVGAKSADLALVAVLLLRRFRLLGSLTRL